MSWFFYAYSVKSSMFKHYAILTISFLTINSLGMELDEKTHHIIKKNDNAGLTFNEIKDHIFTTQKYEPWELCQVLTCTSIALASGTVFFLPTGGVLTAIYCYNSTAYHLLNNCNYNCYTSYKSCNNNNLMNCQNIYDICHGNCSASYVLTPTLNDPICQTGISFLSLYALLSLHGSLSHH